MQTENTNSYGYGGLGNDHIYGTDIADILVGDEGTAAVVDTDLHLDYGATPFADYYNE